MLRESLRLAQVLKELVEADADFELAAPVPFSLVCFRLSRRQCAERAAARRRSTAAARLSLAYRAQWPLRSALRDRQFSDHGDRYSRDLALDLRNSANACSRSRLPQRSAES